MNGSSRKQKCIVTFARSWIGLAATRCLGKQGIYVITGDTDRCAAANFSRYSKEHFIYPDPGTDPEGFVERLVELCKSHAAADTDFVLMPIYTDAYPIICRQDRFNGLAKLALPPKNSYELVRNKARLAEHCTQLGIRVPVTVAAGSAGKFHERALSFAYPAFVKVPTSSGAVGTRKVFSCDEAVRTFDDMVRRYSITEPGLLPILQESVGGDDYCSAFLFDHGEYRASMTYHNVFDFPRGKGVGALRETVDAKRLEEIGRALLGRLGWNGVCQVDFRWDGVSEPWLIEVNPRFWGGLAQSVASGWPFPVWAYELALRGHVDTGKPQKIDVRTSNPVLMGARMLQDLFTVRDGWIKAVAKLIKEARGSVNEFFSWSDPLPVLGFLYPLMVYFKHGTISPELLIGEKGTHKDDTAE